MRVLYIEDDEGDARFFQEVLRPFAASLSITCNRVPSLAEGQRKLDHGGFDLVVVDLGLPDSQGLDTLRAVRVHAPEVATVVLTGLDDEEMALQALRDGAQDYLVKGSMDGPQVARVLQFAIERMRIQNRLSGPRDPDAAVRLIATDQRQHDRDLQEHLAGLAAAGRKVVLVSFDRMQDDLARLADEAGLGNGNVLFVATATLPAGPGGRGGQGAIGLERASRLEVTAMRIESACGRLGSEALVVVDAVNPLLDGHGTAGTLRFLHYVANRMRALGVGADFLVRQDAPGRALTAEAAQRVDAVLPDRHRRPSPAVAPREAHAGAGRMPDRPSGSRLASKASGRGRQD